MEILLLLLGDNDVEMAPAVVTMIAIMIGQMAEMTKMMVMSTCSKGKYSSSSTGGNRGPGLKKANL